MNEQNKKYKKREKKVCCEPLVFRLFVRFSFINLFEILIVS